MGDVFESLYCQTAKIKKEAKLSEEFTFKPKIKSNFTYKRKSQYINKPISQRLLESKTEREQNLNKQKIEKELLETTKDIKTGQKLFQPKITRGPLKPDTGSYSDNYEKLYKNQSATVRKQKNIQNEQKRYETLIKSTYSAQHTEKVLNEAHRKKCMELFNLLDPDNCGNITTSHIRIDYLSSKALEVLEPALLEMENKNLKLNYDSFYKLVTPFLKKLNIAQLREIVAGPKKALDNELSKVFTFAVFFVMYP